MKQDSIIENKPLLTQSRLFLEVSGVIGKVAALEELTLAYREYNTESGWAWKWDDPLAEGFVWRLTPQGWDLWNSINESIKEQDNE